MMMMMVRAGPLSSSDEAGRLCDPVWTLLLNYDAVATSDPGVEPLRLCTSVAMTPLCGYGCFFT